MSKLESLLTDEMIQSCVDDLSDTAIEMTPAQARAMIVADPEFLGTLVKYYSEITKPCSLDTQDRDDLYNTFVVQILGLTHWPTYGEKSEAYKAEFKAAIHKAVADGKIVAFQPD